MTSANDLLAKLLGGAALLAIMAPIIIISSCREEQHKKKFTTYNGNVLGQNVRYMEFPDKNEMEIGRYRLIDSVDFRRLGETNYLNDILERVECPLGENTMLFNRGDTNSIGFDKEVEESLINAATKYYNCVRRMAVENKVLKLEDDESR